MIRKRPCRICKKWFRPAPRAGDRQHVCSRDVCQQKRHRRNCKTWRENNHEAERIHIVRQRFLTVLPENTVPPTRQPPADRLCWPQVRRVVGLEVAVLAEEITKVLRLDTRDSVLP